MVRQDCMRQDSFRRKKDNEANIKSTASFSSSSSTLRQSTTVSPSSTKIKLNETSKSSFNRSEEDESLVI
jgi:hypothetical protein